MKKTLVFSFFALLFAMQANAQVVIKLTTGQILFKGQKITFLDGELNMQDDGNLVFYNYGTARWATGTHGKTVTHAIMQQDGNLVIYNNSTPVWASDTWNVGADGGFFQCDLVTQFVGIYDRYGNLVKQLSASQNSIKLTTGKSLLKGEKITENNGELVLQSDGDLVFSVDNKTVWSTGTAGKTVTHVIMQPDGNLVVYNGSAPVWASVTSPNAMGGYLECHLASHAVNIYSPFGVLVKTLNFQPTYYPSRGGGFNANY